jgi:hypothetical protein
MTTVLEIEKAIGKQPPVEVQQLIDWLEDYRMTLVGSDVVFAMLDKEDGGGDQLVDPESHERAS